MNDELQILFIICAVVLAALMYPLTEEYRQGRDLRNRRKACEAEAKRNEKEAIAAARAAKVAKVSGAVP